MSRWRRRAGAISDDLPRASPAGSTPTGAAGATQIPSTEPTRLAEVEARLAGVEARLAVAAGDRSLCDLSRVGASGSVKDLEGRMAALMEVRRALRRPELAAMGEGAAERAIARIIETWQAALPADEQRSPAWAAYRRGGVAELLALTVRTAADGGEVHVGEGHR